MTLSREYALMKISAKTEYACVAMLELAAHYSTGQPVRVRGIAERHGIPSRFLVQILLQLKGAGLVASVRGAAGGYRMVRPPNEVSLGQVMEAIDGNGEEEISTAASPDSSVVRVLMDTWRDVRAIQREALNKISLAELLERAKDQEGQMFFI